MHIRSTELLQSEKPSCPNARAWKMYIPPGLRPLIGIGGLVLAAVTFVQVSASPAGGTLAYRSS